MKQNRQRETDMGTQRENERDRQRETYTQREKERDRQRYIDTWRQKERKLRKTFNKSSEEKGSKEDQTRKGSNNFQLLKRGSNTGK